MTSHHSFHFIRLVVLLSFILTIPCQAKNPFVERFDQNGDGKLSKSEVPAPARRIFENVDKNGDGFVTPEVNISGSDVVDNLMVVLMIITIDEGFYLRFRIN